MQNFILALEIVHSISRPLKLFCENFATESFSRNTKSTSCSKHIDVKFFFVKEKVVESLIFVEYTPTTDMLADPLTKGLPICVFQKHVIHMELLRAETLFLVGVFPFHVFCKEISYFLVIKCTY